MKRWYKLTVLWFCLGAVYFLMEMIWRIPRGELPHPAMIVVGGLCGLAVGSINQIPAFYQLSARMQSLIGTAITLVVEFLSGYVLNIRMGLAIWDYSGLPLNIMGQVCLGFGVIWFMIMPFAIWLEDHLRLGFWNEGTAYSLPSIYYEWLTGRK